MTVLTISVIVQLEQTKGVQKGARSGRLDRFRCSDNSTPRISPTVLTIATYDLLKGDMTYDDA